MKNKTKAITFTGVFSAMIFVLTYFIKIPVASGYVHFGDALVYLSAGFIGPWAILAGAIGEGFADLASGYSIYIPATVIIKALIGLLFACVYKNKEKLFSVATALTSLFAGVITVAGYFIADLIIDKAYAIVDITGNVIQAIGSAVIFIVLSLAFDSAKLKAKIKL